MVKNILLFGIFLMFAYENIFAVGTCGTAHLKTFSSSPSNSELCGSQVVVNYSAQSSLWYWQCYDVNPKAAPYQYSGSCYAFRQQVPPVNGACGTAHAKTFPYTATSFSGYTICVSGTASPSPSFPYLGGFSTWKCLGSNGGSDASCYASRERAPINGQCGSLNQTNNYSISTTSVNLCSVGGVKDFRSTFFDWTWSCEGSYGGVDASCNAKRIVIGQCPTLNPSRVEPSPSCTLGTPGEISLNNNAWQWTCVGLNGGGSSVCKVDRIIDGACGSSHGKTLYTMPSSELCLLGQATYVFIGSDTSSFNWICRGTNGGTSQYCNAKYSSCVENSCGTSNGKYSLSEPNNLCINGAVPGLLGLDKDSYVWTCSMSSVITPCFAYKDIIPSCGADAGKHFFDSPPKDNLCASGVKKFIAYSSGRWFWACEGSKNRPLIYCQASQQTSAICGSVSGTTVSSLSSSSTNLCKFGSLGSIYEYVPGYYLWTCNSSYGGSVSCYARKN